MPGSHSPQIGQLAVSRGLLTAEQLSEALAELESRRAAGSQVPLGELLIELGFVTRVQLEVILTAQGAGPPDRKQPIDGYELIKKLGEGGMGATYLARQTSMDRLVALKILRRNLSRNSEYVERFRREAQLAGKLDHVNIVGALDVGESGGFHYLAMEYVEGRNFYDVMPEGQALDEGLALHVVMQMARALDYAHCHGIIHRDIKPDNIMVDAKGIAKLCDFGLARHTGSESRLTQTGVMMGTPHYVSPEQARGEKDVDIRSDIYSLGATLYHAVTGQTPFTGSSAAVVMTKHLTDQMPWPQDVNPGVSDYCCRVIEKMMAKDREARYPTPAELVADLELVIDGKPPAGAALSPGMSSVGRAGTVPAHGAAATMPGAPPPPPPSGVRSPAARTVDTRPLDAVDGRKPPLPASVMAGLGAVAVLAVIGVVWMLVAGGGAEPAKPPDGGQTPPGVEVPDEPGNPDEPGSEDERLKEMFEYAAKWRAEHPADLDEARAKFEQVRADSAGTVWAMRAGEEIRKIDRTRDAALDAALAEFRDAAEKLAADGDFDAALALLEKRPDSYAEELRPRLAAERDEVRRRAEDKIREILDEVERLSGRGQPAEGLDKLNEAAKISFAPARPGIEELRERLTREKENEADLAGKRRQAAAEDHLAGVLDEFDRLAVTGDHTGALRHLAVALPAVPKEYQKTLSARLDAAGRLAGAMAAGEKAFRDQVKALVGKEVKLRDNRGAVHEGTVKSVSLDEGFLELRVNIRMGGVTGSTVRRLRFEDFAPEEMNKLAKPREPTTPDEFMAEALLAVGADDFEWAREALRLSGNHPLADRYRRLLDERAGGAAEEAARRAWETEVEPLVREPLPPPEADRLRRALEDYIAAHGGTQFARDRKGEVDELSGRVAGILGDPGRPGEPEPGGDMAEKVGRFFRGEVKRFDPDTCEIELFYDFEDPEQLRDWRLSDWGRDDARPGSLRVERGALRIAETRQFAMMVAWFEEAFISADFKVDGGMNVAELLIGADEGRGFYLLCGLSGAKKTFLSKCVDMRDRGRFETLLKEEPSPFAARKGGTMSLGCRDGVVKSKVGDKAREVRDDFLRSGHAGLRAPYTAAYFDNVTVKGRLDRGWLEDVLGGGRKGPGGDGPFRAGWKELELPGETPGRRTGITTAMTYDPKRKRCVLFGGSGEFPGQGWIRPNDLWALDLGAMRWTCLQKNDPKGAGRPPGDIEHHFSYDAGNDLYWLGTHWAFEPEAGRWKQRAGNWEGEFDKARFGKPGVDRKSWAYFPDEKCFLHATWSDLGLMTFLCWPGTNKVEQLPAGPIPPRSFVDGGLAYDRAHKVFVLFGGNLHKGQKFDDTWTFDPRGKAWREMRPARSPAPRSYHRLVWHEGIGALVMFGGQSQDGGLLNDLWVYEPGVDIWTELHTDPSPPPEGGATAYDAEHNVLVRFTASGQTWAAKIERDGPPPRDHRAGPKEHFGPGPGPGPGPDEGFRPPPGVRADHTRE